MLRAIAAVAIFIAANPVYGREEERACVTVTRMYFAQLDQNMNGCEAKITGIKAESRRCKKFLKKAKIDLKRLSSLEQACSERQGIASVSEVSAH